MSKHYWAGLHMFGLLEFVEEVGLSRSRAPSVGDFVPRDVYCPQNGHEIVDSSLPVFWNNPSPEKLKEGGLDHGPPRREAFLQRKPSLRGIAMLHPTLTASSQAWRPEGPAKPGHCDQTSPFILPTHSLRLSGRPAHGLPFLRDNPIHKPLSINRPPSSSTCASISHYEPLTYSSSLACSSDCIWLGFIPPPYSSFFSFSCFSFILFPSISSSCHLRLLHASIISSLLQISLQDPISIKTSSSFTIPILQIQCLIYCIRQFLQP
nr:hypothetical protein Iba_chr10cCG11460 [Ipomoea batatas]